MRNRFVILATTFLMITVAAAAWGQTSPATQTAPPAKTGTAAKPSGAAKPVVHTATKPTAIINTTVGKMTLHSVSRQGADWCGEFYWAGERDQGLEESGQRGDQARRAAL